MLPIALRGKLRRTDVACDNIGQLQYECTECKALFFDDEIKTRGFSTCCENGALTCLRQFPAAPPMIRNLICGMDPTSQWFQTNVRAINSSLSFASISANVDTSVQTRGTYNYRISGNIYTQMHDIPADVDPAPRFANVYMYDPDIQLDLRNLFLNTAEDEDKKRIINDIQNLLIRENPIAQTYQRIQQVDQSIPVAIYFPAMQNPPQEFAIIIQGDALDALLPNHLCVRRSDNGQLKFVPDTHPLYDSLIFPLMFAYGWPAWSPSLKYHVNNAMKNVTCLKFYRYHLMIRSDVDGPHIWRRLFQQYLVIQGYKLECGRLRWLRNNQDKIRADVYFANREQNNTKILPSSFTGGPRYMRQCYMDAMAIAMKFGNPDLFLTMTCNPNWPEIKDNLPPGFSPSDRPDLIVRVFYQKLKNMMHEIKKKRFSEKWWGISTLWNFKSVGCHTHTSFFF